MKLIADEVKSFSLDVPPLPSQQILSIDFGDAVSFIQGSFPTYIGSPKLENEGSHLVIVSVKDIQRYPSHYMTTFYIIVQKSSALIAEEAIMQKFTVTDENLSSKDLEASIWEITVEGVVTIKFKKKVVVP